MTTLTAESVLEFWFTELTPDQWFRGGETVDHLVKQRFSSLLDEVRDGQHHSWADSPEGRLALILVLDQFPRNIYRGTDRSFAYDPKALELTLKGIEEGDDLKLGHDHRAFFYLPLEHSENIEIQDQSVERYANLVLSVPPEQRDSVRHYLDYAWKHYVIIKQFGRYPHRNAILERESTAEEAAFLEGPNSSF